MSEERRKKELEFIQEMRKKEKKTDTRSVKDIISTSRKAEQMKTLAPEKNAESAAKAGTARQSEAEKAIKAARKMKEDQRKRFSK